MFGFWFFMALMILFLPPSALAHDVGPPASRTIQEPAPPVLAADPAYFEQGAITEMGTCLEVAADALAKQLWSNVIEPLWEGMRDKPWETEKVPTISQILGPKAAQYLKPRPKEEKHDFEGRLNKFEQQKNKFVSFFPEEAEQLLKLSRRTDVKRKSAPSTLLSFLQRTFLGIDAISRPLSSAPNREGFIQYRTARSFGILYACAHIYTAWNATFPPYEIRNAQDAASDGTVEHGIVVLDMRLGQRRGLLDPVSLVRIIMAPKLLPPAAYGGLVVANAAIAGPLIFPDVRVDTPLAFENVVFGGGAYRRAHIGDRPLHSSVAIVKSTFARSLTFAGSMFCDTFRIFDAHLEGVLEFDRIEPSTNSEEPFLSEYECDPGGLFIQSTTSDTINLRHVSFESVVTTNSQIDTFDVIGALINKALVWRENQLGSLWVFESTFGELEARQNQISRNLHIQNPTVRSLKSRFVVSNNQIGGALMLEGFRPGSVLSRETLDLTNNTVQHNSRLCVPYTWKDEIIDLSGSKFTGKLLIDLSLPYFDRYEIESCISARDADLISTLDCSGSLDWIGGEFGRGGTSRAKINLLYHLYCADDEGRFLGKFCGNEDHSFNTREFAVFDLSAAEIGNLHWNLPLSCKWRWSGFGLSYKIWEPPLYSGLTEWTAFKAWRTSLAKVEPSPLFQMAKYLSDRGDQVGSQGMNLEARRLKYAPECAPSESFWNCLRQIIMQGRLLERSNREWMHMATIANLNRTTWGLVQPANNERLSRYSSAEEQHKAELRFSSSAALQSLGQVLRTVQLLIVAPIGYGAMPERLVQLVLISWIGFHSIYMLYAWFCARQERLGRATSWRGNSGVPGFSQRSENSAPRKFEMWKYSIDTMVPMFNLHTYDEFYPEWAFMRTVSSIQHILGWVGFTVFAVSVGANL